MWTPRTPTAAAFAAALAVGLGLAGCSNSDKKCPTESPGVTKIADCQYPPGATVSYSLQLCPTCNQNITGCDVDTSQVGSSGKIFLNPVVEVCDSAGSCGGASCNVNPSTCTFTAPATTGSYTVIVYDPQAGTTRQGTLTVQAGPASCTNLHI